MGNSIEKSAHSKGASMCKGPEQGRSLVAQDAFQRDPPGFKIPKMHSFFFFLVFLGPYPWHLEVPRLGVLSELQLPAYTTATATQDPSRICNL